MIRCNNNARASFVRPMRRSSAGRSRPSIWTAISFARRNPLDGAFVFSQVAGAGEFDVAVRIVADKNLSGAMSARGKSGVCCLGRDERADGDVACDAIFPTP